MGRSRRCRGIRGAKGECGHWGMDGGGDRGCVRIFNSAGSNWAGSVKRIRGGDEIGREGLWPSFAQRVDRAADTCNSRIEGFAVLRDIYHVTPAGCDSAGREQFNRVVLRIARKDEIPYGFADGDGSCGV